MILEKLYQRFPPTSKADGLFFVFLLILVLIGIIMVISSSTIIGFKEYADEYFFVKRHLIYLTIASCGFIFGYIIPHFIWRRLSQSLWIASLFMVALTYIPGIGVTVYGSTRWINLVGFSFQPSEVLKFALIVFVAKLLTKKESNILNFKETLLPTLIVIGISVLIVLKQPDLGTSMLISLVTLSLLFIAGLTLIHVLWISLLGITFSGWSILSNPYQLSRIQAFLDPWKDPLGKGYHTIQSLIAIGSGGLLGLGIGRSRQKFFYLPQQYTDYIFSIFSEEFGFIIVVSFILLLIVYIFRGFLIAIRAYDPFSKLLAMGIIIWISLQSILNIGVTMSLLPPTGITLPFISYGGTSLIMVIFASGVLLNISRYNQ